MAEKDVVSGGRLLGWSAASFGLLVLAHGSYALILGPRMSPDSGTFSRWADLLWAHGFNYVEYWAATSDSLAYPVWPYTGFVTAVATSKMVFGTHWQWGIVGLNVIATSSACAVMVGLGLMITRSRVAAGVALLLFLGAFEIFSWERYVLSDSTFLSLSVLIYSLFAAGFLASRHSLHLVAGGLALVPLALVYRPSGVLLLPIIALALVLWHKRARIFTILEARPRAPAGLLPAVVALAVLIAIGNAWFMQDPARWPFVFGSDVIEYNARLYAMGQIVWDRPETYHTQPRSLVDFLAITGDRFLHYFYFTFDAFSRRHNIGATLFFVPTYVLGLYGAYVALTTPVLRARNRMPVILSLSAILVFAVVQSLVQIDYDWRYRVPAVPHMILLAAVGVAALEVQFRERFRSAK